MSMIKNPHVKTVNMTTGSIAPILIRFAIPMLLGNLFQQLYNTVDTWVVGNYVSNTAFAAVGNVGTVTNVLIGFFNGLATGSSVCIAQNFGAGKEEKVRDAVHTVVLMTFVLGVVFTLLGRFFTPFAIRFMKVPADTAPDAATYLNIYFAGIMGLMMYNMGAAILRAVGNSKQPFYLLLLTSVINIVLDLLFVIRFRMGVEGVAYATIFSQFISAIAIFVIIYRSDSCIRFHFSGLRYFDPGILKTVFTIGVPAGIQVSLTSFANMFAHSYINAFGTDVMSGWSVYSKINQIIILPNQSLGLAATTFVSQNVGVGNYKRTKQGAHLACYMGLSISIVLIIILDIFTSPLVRFFNPKPEVVYYGTLLIHFIGSFHFVTALTQVFAGALRGTGDSKTPMLFQLTIYIGLRQLYMFIMSHYISNTLLPVVMIFPICWVILGTLFLILFNRRVRMLEMSAAKNFS